MVPLKRHGRYCVHCVITLFWGVSLAFRMCNLPGHEFSLYCVLFSCTCEIYTARNCLFMKLINLVIFMQDQKGDPLNVLSSICIYPSINVADLSGAMAVWRGLIPITWQSSVRGLGYLWPNLKIIYLSYIANGQTPKMILSGKCSSGESKSRSNLMKPLDSPFIWPNTVPLWD